MERESFIFYRSFYDSIKGLGDAEFAECMRFPIGKPMVLRRKTIGYGMQNLM